MKKYVPTFGELTQNKTSISKGKAKRLIKKIMQEVKGDQFLEVTGKNQFQLKRGMDKDSEGTWKLSYKADEDLLILTYDNEFNYVISSFSDFMNHKTGLQNIFYKGGDVDWENQ